MKHQIFFDTYNECRHCNIPKMGEFKYVEYKKNTHVNFISKNAYTLIFIMSGKLSISCNEFIDTIFNSKEMCLIPITANCSIETMEDSAAIILIGDKDTNICDKIGLKLYSECWLNTQEKFGKLKTKHRLTEFLHSVKNYLDDGIVCPQMHLAKQRELSSLFRAYYPLEEIVDFFFPTVKYNHDFETFIMNNYLKMKGVKEFVDLSGLNLSTFNRKFKAHFGMSPYQWLIKQKSKHILHELKMGNRSIADIMKEFEFSDASHFNRYCKNMLGASPSEIRKKRKTKIQATEYQ